MVPFFCFVAAIFFVSAAATPINHAKRLVDGIHIPLVRYQAARTQRRSQRAGAIGLGNVVDVTYNVLVQIGSTRTPLVLDTGSSDLWVLSDACKSNCSSAKVPLYPISTFKDTGLDVHLLYGDSFTGTHAKGPIGKDTVGVAGLILPDQYFAAISDTNTSILQTGSAGIFGLGFPVNSFRSMTDLVYSVIWNKLLSAKVNGVSRRSTDSSIDSSFASRVFPDFSFVHPASELQSRQSFTITVHDVLETFESNGPLVSRLATQGKLAAPLVTITLQRDTVDVGGNLGMLSIGELPRGVKADSLTWVSLRGYTTAEGGLPAPAESPNEVYPLAWEIPIDDVYFDGQKLPKSNLTSSKISLSALVDTGNSLIRGPQDVVQAVMSRLGKNTYPCGEAHTLAFKIGGKMFNVDPRDFGSQTYINSVDQCSPNLVATDPPGEGFLYSWSLGDPFLKSALVSFYYGNLTYPSKDAPRIGLLSTVPDDAAVQLQSAVSAAASSNGNLPVVSHSAPSGTLVAASTNTLGVAQACASMSGSNPRQSSGTVVLIRINGSFSFVTVLFLMACMLVLYI
ncbi:aspartic peptidase [Heterobasidion irregulare TC 32-1]|uniref:Aspartic peptidase n=1 Tax=Heterobasidion irregulare (strain TC 32-1) TaxID=747525 RepID=W4JPX4_HETIT|nr:aspartic peptidase [Heterobasidion irregulare TC 32-1]ETW75583.1 aspartic peptidase [Heterobasidion irregulare TC 32-1]